MSCVEKQDITIEENYKINACSASILLFTKLIFCIVYSAKKKKTEADWLSLSRIHLKSVLRVPYAREWTVFKNISKRLLTLFRFLFLLSNFTLLFTTFSISANLLSISSMSMRLCLKRQLKQLKNFSLKTYAMTPSVSWHILKTVQLQKWQLSSVFSLPICKFWRSSRKRNRSACVHF